jgi:hypothetical protein
MMKYSEILDTTRHRPRPRHGTSLRHSMHADTIEEWMHSYQANVNY